MLARSNQPRGFTLIELIIVLMIITVVVDIVSPNLTGFTLGRMNRNTATGILAMTHYARTKAVTEGRTYRLNYDERAGTMYITYEPAGAIVTPGDEFNAPLTIDSRIRVETDIPKQTDGQYIEFHATG